MDVSDLFLAFARACRPTHKFDAPSAEWVETANSLAGKPTSWLCYHYFAEMHRQTGEPMWMVCPW